MEWSEQEQDVMEELRQLPAFNLTSERRHRMFQEAAAKAQGTVRNRRRMRAVGGLGVVAATLVLGVALYQAFGSQSGTAQTPTTNRQLQASKQTNLFHSGAAADVQPMSVVFEVKPVGENKVDADGLQVTRFILQQRLREMEIQEATVKVVEPNRLAVRVDEPVNKKLVTEALQKRMVLEFRTAQGKVVASGKDLKPDSHVVTDDHTGTFQVLVEFEDPNKFATITHKYLGQVIEIWLDGELLQEPIIQSVIKDGVAVISQQDQNMAEIMATNLRSGSQPLAYELAAVKE
ncbi:MAG TPA: hypothetical protein VFV52_14355 [Bacilli bacterium]|nr:hypothetical protein [Bacilli bacterium]